MAKRFKAAIIGGSGYGAAEMLRRLIIHPEVEVVRVASIDLVGEPVWVAHPNLTGLSDLVLENISPAEAAKGCDVALLALPHKVTASKVPELIELGVKIVDMSGDFRLRDADEFREHYGREHTAMLAQADFVYGLTETNRERIKGARRISNPGCFATATLLGLAAILRQRERIRQSR